MNFHRRRIDGTLGTMGFPDLLDKAEQLLTRISEHQRLRSRSSYWNRNLKVPDDIRGRRCHCPEDIDFHFVHSEGIRECADVVIDYSSNVENSARPQAPVDLVARIAPLIPHAAVVYVKADLLAQVSELIIPRLSNPIILVTAESDWSPTDDFRGLLDHPRILHWFCQNAALSSPHPHLTPIPIGLDNPVYTLLERRVGFLADQLAGKRPIDLLGRKNITGEQRRFNAAVAANQLWVGRKPLRVLCAYSKGHLPDRATAARALSAADFAHVATQPIPQEKYWHMHRDFAFEVSPPGNGLDCFRTWEALALGTIPIVRSGPLDSLYEKFGFPVAIVESWSEVNQDNLKKWSMELVPRLPHCRPRLSNSYWTELIRGKAEII